MIAIVVITVITVAIVDVFDDFVAHVMVHFFNGDYNSGDDKG